MTWYFPEPFGRDINVKVNLSNYATKFDLKNATGIDISKLASKLAQANLVTKINFDNKLSSLNKKNYFK